MKLSILQKYDVKLSILQKMLVVMLVISVVPLITLGYCASSDAKALGLSAANDAKWMGKHALQDSTKALEELGVRMIEQKAADVAGQCAIYIRAHPEMSVSDLQASPEFQKIAVQPVGETGSTCLYEQGSGIMRLHSNPDLVDLDMSSLQATLPEFWELFYFTLSGNVVGGYYDWINADGQATREFMSAVPIEGTEYMLAATISVEEFSEPIVEIQNDMNEEIAATNARIRESTESLSTQNTILVITAITVIVTGVVGFLFATSISRPIKTLTEIADKVSMGDLEGTEIDIRSDDEIGALAESFQRMVVSVKYYMAKAQAAAQPPGGDEA